jgi:hypothetical protein
MKILHDATSRRMSTGERFFPCVIVNGERFVDWTVPHPGEEAAILSAQMMAERMMASIKSQLKANHYSREEI